MVRGHPSHIRRETAHRERNRHGTLPANGVGFPLKSVTGVPNATLDETKRLRMKEKNAMIAEIGIATERRSLPGWILISRILQAQES